MKEGVMRKFGPTTYAMKTFAGLFSSTVLVAPFVAFKKAVNQRR